MDDNKIMEAAKLTANSSAALIQAIGMMSENIERANRGGTWYLYWYDHDDNPEMIKIERREILLLN